MIAALIYFTIALVHAIAIIRPQQAEKVNVVMVILYISLAGVYAPFPLASA